MKGNSFYFYLPVSPHRTGELALFFPLLPWLHGCSVNRMEAALTRTRARTQTGTEESATEQTVSKRKRKTDSQTGSQLKEKARHGETEKQC